MRGRFTVLAVLVAVLAGSALLIPKGASRRDPATPRAALEITIDNFSFNRGSVTVERGTEVTWLNRDDMPHTVTSNDKSFASPPLDTGDRFSHTFDKPGTYGYFCSIHPRMTGTILVR